MSLSIVIIIHSFVIICTAIAAYCSGYVKGSKDVKAIWDEHDALFRVEQYKKIIKDWYDKNENPRRS